MKIERLYLLIQSLDQGEKKKFASYTNKKSLKRYEKLYLKLKKEGLTRKALSQLNETFRHACRDLVRQLLERLRSYDQKRQNKHLIPTRSKQIKNQLLDAYFLFNKGFYDVSWEKLLATKKIALAIYAYPSVLEINRLLVNILLQVSNGSPYSIKTSVTTDAIYAETLVYMRHYKDYLFHNQRYVQLKLQATKSLDHCEIHTIQKEFKPYISSVPPITPLAKHRFLQAKAIYYRLVQDKAQALESNKEALNWWHQPENTIYLQEEQYRYLLTLINIINYSIEAIVYAMRSPDQPSNLVLSLYQQIEQYLNIVKTSLRVTGNWLTQKDKALVEIAYFKSCLLYYQLQQDFEKGKLLIEQIQQTKKLHLFTIKDQKILVCQYIQIYFRLNDYVICLYYSHHFYQLHHKYPAIRQDLFKSILPLIILSSITVKEKKESIGYLPPIEQLIAQAKGVFSLGKEASYYHTIFDLLATFMNPPSRQWGSKNTALYRLAHFICKNMHQPHALEIYCWLKSQPVSKNFPFLT